MLKFDSSVSAGRYLSLPEHLCAPRPPLFTARSRTFYCPSALIESPLPPPPPDQFTHKPKDPPVGQARQQCC